MIEASSLNTVSQDLFEQWCKRWFAEDEIEDEAADLDGRLIEAINQKNRTWLLPGTTGRRIMSERVLNISPDTKLFVVGGSSHAFPKHVGNPNATCAELEKHAERIHALWNTNGTLRIDILYGRDLSQLSAQALEKVVVCTDVFVNPDSYYASTFGVSGNVRTTSIAHIHLFEPLSPGTHYIRLIAVSRADESLHEPLYELDVTYKVNVQKN